MISGALERGKSIYSCGREKWGVFLMVLRAIEADVVNKSLCSSSW